MWQISTVKHLSTLRSLLTKLVGLQLRREPETVTAEEFDEHGKDYLKAMCKVLDEDLLVPLEDTYQERTFGAQVWNELGVKPCRTIYEWPTEDEKKKKEGLESRTFGTRIQAVHGVCGLPSHQSSLGKQGHRRPSTT